jgi:hypothetical protein
VKRVKVANTPVCLRRQIFSVLSIKIKLQRELIAVIYLLEISGTSVYNYRSLKANQLWKKKKKKKEDVYSSLFQIELISSNDLAKYGHIT